MSLSTEFPRAPRWVWAVLLLLVFLGLVLPGRQRASAQDDTSVRPTRQTVTVDIDDRHSLAVTTVRQEFANKAWQEQAGSILLPIPDEAALLRYTVLTPPARKGEKPEERGQLQAAGRNQYQATIARVPGNGKAQVEIVYAEALTRRGARRKYVYPIPPPGQGHSPGSIAVEIRIDARAAPERLGSATHEMRVRRPTPNDAVLTYASTEPSDGRDLVVDYELPSGLEDQRARLAVLTPADSRQDPYFLLTLPPPAALFHGSRALQQPADILFCMDISGSTRGRKLNAIQEAVHDGLADLTPRDRFGVIAFDDDARPFRKQMVPASPGAVQQAVRWVSRLRPGAGNNPERALKAAMEVLATRGSARGRLPVIAVVVDSEDTDDLGATAASLGLGRRGIRLVMLGAKSDSRLVNFRLAGRKLQSGPAIALSRAVVTYGPALAKASFDGGSLNASYIYPSPERLPDLPLSTPVVLFGRLNQAPPSRGTVRLRGRVEGRTQEFPVDYVWQPLAPGSPVPQLWANRRVRRLLQLAGRDEGNPQELTDAIPQVQRETGLAAVPGG